MVSTLQLRYDEHLKISGFGSFSQHTETIMASLRATGPGPKEAHSIWVSNLIFHAKHRTLGIRLRMVYQCFSISVMINAQKIPKCTATQIIAFSRDWGQVFVSSRFESHPANTSSAYLVIGARSKKYMFFGCNYHYIPLQSLLTGLSYVDVVLCYGCTYSSILRRSQVGPSASLCPPEHCLELWLVFADWATSIAVSHTYKEITTEFHRSQSLSFRLYSRQHAIHRS